ncbi:MAG: hypothetical protein ABUL44_00895, partial [Flavobacterium sp.]
MQTIIENQDLLLPNTPIIKEATLNAFKRMNGVDMAEVEKFIENASVPAPIGAKASVIFGVIYGSLTVNPTSEYKNCVFDHDFWGIGAVGGTAIGVIYTAYENWPAFFSNVTGFHVQGIGAGGGI